MDKRYLLDTNICIYIAKHHPTIVRKRFESLAFDQIAMSVITFGELQFGVEKSQKREESLKTLDQLAKLIQISPLPEKAGECYGKIRNQLQKMGLMIGNNDLWIAAHAMAESWTLVTNNVREFQRIEDLEIENWTSG